MTKKRLSDLLRDEVEKSSDQEVAISQPKSANPSTDQSADTTAQQAAVAAPSTQSPSNARGRSNRKSPAAEELQAKIAELTTELKTAHQQETSLQQQTVNLQSELQQQIALCAGLSSDLKQVKGQLEQKETQLNRLTAELDEAKKMILQLSEVNAKPLAESQPLASQRTQKTMRPPLHKVGLKRLPQYCIQSEPKSTTLSDDEIGWVD